MLGRLRPPSRLRPPIAIAASLLAAISLVAPSLVAAAGTAVSITESGSRYQFTPGTITVVVGDTVSWRNSSNAPHTVTSDAAGGPMHSSLLNQGDSYQATFDTAGTFTYHCQVHPYMHGTIRVEAAAARRTPPAGATPLPPTDAATRASLAIGRRATLLGLPGLATFFAVLLFGSRLRRRSSCAVDRPEEDSVSR